jgi:arylformamidase
MYPFHNLMKRPWKDVSVPLRDGMVHWPGDPECHIKRVNRMEDGAVCNLTHLSMSAHTGTHMDAPRHFIADGITMEQMPFEAVIGRCRVFELDCEDQITADDLKKLRLAPASACCSRHATQREAGRRTSSTRTLSPSAQDAAQYLVDQEVMTVGVDYLSIGGFNKDGSKRTRSCSAPASG